MKPDSASSSPLSAVAIFSASAGVYQRTILASYAPWRLAAPASNRMSAPQAVLTPYFFASS